MSKWFIGADDSSNRSLPHEAIKIMGSGAVTTARDAEGKMTVTAPNDLSPTTTTQDLTQKMIQLHLLEI